MIKTNNAYVLVATLVVIGLAIAGLELGFVPLAGGVTESPAAGSDAPVGNLSAADRLQTDIDTGPLDASASAPATDLTDEDGRIIGERRYDTPPARFERKAAEYPRAKEIQQPTGFINAENVTLSQYVGEKVVLVEFWTYGCYNCQNTHPYIKEYWRQYGDEGLVVVGVHKPEFAYERKPANVLEYVQKTNTTYPVVLDNEDGTWDAYEQRYWPTRYLIDVDGFVRYKEIGEGGYNETHEQIRKLLEEREQLVDDE